MRFSRLLSLRPLLRRFGLGSILWATCLFAEPVQTYEPPLPQARVAAVSDSSGYFPTLAEDALLRGAYDSRLFGNANDGPDAREQNATGLFPYQDPVPNFFQRHSAFFQPVDQVLGIFNGFDAWTWESDRLRNAAITVDAHGGIFTRSFDPNLAMVKAGPLFFDLLWVGAGAVWSDYNGPQSFGPDNGDGFTGYIDIGLRAMLRLTDTIYLSVAANLIYLPFENRIAFGSGLSAGFPGAGISLLYGDTVGAWDIQFYDNFWGRPGLNFFADASSGAVDRAGRYFFGFQQPRGNEFFNENGVVFGNQIGFNATRLVFDNQWRYWFDVEHHDFWSTFNFTNHGTRDHIGTWLGYEGSIIPFAPRISYDLFSYDGYDTLFHQFALQLTGRITENLSWNGQTGVLFGDDSARFIWQIGLEHAITEKTVQWLRFGEWVFHNDLRPESLVSRFVSYGINQRLSRQSSLTAFIQYADAEAGINTPGVNERLSAGVRLSIQPLDFTNISLLALYETSDNPAPSASIDDYDRWLYRIEIMQQLGVRLTGQLFYQYEEATNASSFSEHAVGVSLRRYF